MNCVTFSQAPFLSAMVKEIFEEIEDHIEENLYVKFYIQNVDIISLDIVPNVQNSILNDKYHGKIFPKVMTTR